MSYMFIKKRFDIYINLYCLLIYKFVNSKYKQVGCVLMRTVTNEKGEKKDENILKGWGKWKRITYFNIRGFGHKNGSPPSAIPL